jgi:hypothetical protein
MRRPDEQSDQGLRRCPQRCDGPNANANLLNVQPAAPAAIALRRALSRCPPGPALAPPSALESASA